MSIAARLNKIERVGGVGVRCLNCRVHYIKFGDEIKRTAAADLFVTTCRDCGLPLKLILSGYTQGERDVVISVMTAEDRESDGLKWLAGYAWMHHLPRFIEIEEIGQAEERRLRDFVRRDASARRQVKVLDEFTALHERRQKAYDDQREKDARDKMPSVLAPVIDALDEVRKEQHTLDHKVFLYRVMAEMEVFMWGKKSAETLKLIADRQQFLDDEKACLKREAEEREQKYREERRLREEEQRRRKEEWLARYHGSSDGAG